MQREWLRKIPELKLGGKAESMTETQFKGYLQSLNAFIDGFPALSEKMRDAADKKASAALVGVLGEISNLLGRISADDLVKECRTLINSVNGGVDYDEIETLTEQFISGANSLSIDVQMAMKRADKPPVARTASTASSKFGRRILAVDNAVMFLNTLKKLLKEQPYELDCMTSCDEALEYLKKNSPKVILLDIEMPDMDGYELAKRIKRTGQSAPIIFITANSEREYVDKAIEVGAAGLLVKPLRINQLLAKLKEFA